MYMLLFLGRFSWLAAAVCAFRIWTVAVSVSVSPNPKNQNEKKFVSLHGISTSHNLHQALLTLLHTSTSIRYFGDTGDMSPPLFMMNNLCPKFKFIMTTIRGQLQQSYYPKGKWAKALWTIVKIVSPLIWVKTHTRTSAMAVLWTISLRQCLDLLTAWAADLPICT